ncbi:MAG: GNAT family N-acetyltransferase [Candidatus Hydrogenedentes bacterium]|nr:GNAT family N-acetyltransferase [Candidatus Hydrogenedentota bacterium]
MRNPGYGVKLAWIGMVLVHPGHRKQGTGSALLKHRLEYQRARPHFTMSVQPGATPPGVQFT